MPQHECILSTLPGSHETERVLIVLVNPGGESVVELRQQSWGEGVGWFTQSHVRLDPQQVAQLKQSLGQTSSAPMRRSPRPHARGGFVPRVVHAESA